VLAPGGSAAPGPSEPVYDSVGHLVETPFVPSSEPPRLSEEEAGGRLLAHPKVAAWLARYPPGSTTEASFERKTRRWRVAVWSGAAGQVALGVVEDGSGRVLEAWTGPQVAWKMARGRPGAFGGRLLNRAPVWIALCGVFFLGLADLRRLRSLRNLDLLVLLSFSASLAFFNRGEIFTSVPLAYPPLAYLFARATWIGFRGRREALPRSLWPVWVLAAATVFLVGFRIGLNVQSPRSVIDVGYAGVIGADRILHGQAPYGHMPVQAGRPPCGTADAEGEIRDRIQTNGRCESANERGDTYGPVAYLAYVPATAALGWSGRWDGLPAARATAIAFDLLVLAFLVLAGVRSQGARLAATLAFAWAAYPFTAYALVAGTNDAIMPALLVLGFLVAGAAAGRGALTALAAWTKFASLLLLPLWLTYPGRPARHDLVRFAAAFAAATAIAFAVLLLEPNPFSAARTFYDRTLGFQLSRESPFSLWGWGQYHARGIPGLRPLQLALEGLLLVFCGALAAVPARKGPLQLAALTAAVLLGFQLVLTHWFYLYLPWVLPFLALALFLPARRGAEAPATSREGATGSSPGPA
jgi:hypothetical protein